jgi:predicted nucleic acid-binding protein
VLVDSSVVLDVLLERLPFYPASAQALAAIEQGAASGSLCSTTITTVYYVARKHFGRDTALAQVASLVKLFEIVPISRSMF